MDIDDVVNYNTAIVRELLYQVVPSEISTVITSEEDGTSPPFNKYLCEFVSVWHGNVSI